MDYIVPMPMNVARLSEYMHVYDVDTVASCVVVDDGEPVGLGMLGVRSDRSWITRLGVVANKRRDGAGRMIMDFLFASSKEKGVQNIWLEVIAGNKPAHAMFKRYGFEQTRELLVIRRPPNFQSEEAERVDDFIQEITPIPKPKTIELLNNRRERPNWLNETESMQNVHQLEALKVVGLDGAWGWASFDVGRFQLSRIVVEVIEGDPEMVAAALLRAIHRHYPDKDTVIENVASDDPKWPGFQLLGYFDSFRRIEMVCKLG